MMLFDVSSSRQLIPGTQSQLGESPIWCERSKSLLWVDIKKGKLHRLYPNKKDHVDTIDIPLLTSAVLLTEKKETFLLVNIKGLYFINYETGETKLYHQFNFNHKVLRTNESQVSPSGTLYFSTMDQQANKPIGSIYKFHAKSKLCEEIHSNLFIPNTMQWFKQDFWFADSGQKVFYQQNLKTKEIKEHPMKYTIDGSALTKEGILINASWGDSKLVLYDLCNSMKVVGEIKIEPTQPTSCTFTGDSSSILYITSAYDDLETIDISDGMITKITSQYSGKPTNRFKF
ncbi:SMP-30/gluconolactonase/LRE family protein [Providencia rettgeri]|uniref:SMP-30/gluconolactonase/LRE family protein n=1 Tax=Providencia rettgeri TaxID=587 RepID=UPI0013739A15|nr:SMP-30/gluconolactonase/LRE family protein [Providencia rettgeri]BBV02334.1 gluconolactonase [Providencia rettgeri]